MDNETPISDRAEQHWKDCEDEIGGAVYASAMRDLETLANELADALENSRQFLHAQAIKNPKWTATNGAVQDPGGIWAICEQVNTLLARFNAMREEAK